MLKEINEKEIVNDKNLYKKLIIKEWIIDIVVIVIIVLLVWCFVGYGVWIISGLMMFKL